jgi:hypothetical protein
MNEDYLNTDECAVFIKRSPGAVRNLVMRKKIPFRKPSGRLVFIKSEIESWMRNAPGMTPAEIAANNENQRL